MSILIVQDVQKVLARGTELAKYVGERGKSLHKNKINLYNYIYCKVTKNYLSSPETFSLILNSNNNGGTIKSS